MAPWHSISGTRGMFMFRSAGDRRAVARQRKIAAQYKRQHDEHVAWCRACFPQADLRAYENYCERTANKNYRKMRYFGHSKASQDSHSYYLKTYGIPSRQEKAADIRQKEQMADIGWNWQDALWEETAEALDQYAKEEAERRQAEIEESWDIYGEFLAPGPTPEYYYRYAC